MSYQYIFNNLMLEGSEAAEAFRKADKKVG